MWRGRLAALLLALVMVTPALAATPKSAGGDTGSGIAVTNVESGQCALDAEPTLDAHPKTPYAATPLLVCSGTVDPGQPEAFIALEGVDDGDYVIMLTARDPLADVDLYVDAFDIRSTYGPGVPEVQLFRHYWSMPTEATVRVALAPGSPPTDFELTLATYDAQVRWGWAFDAARGALFPSSSSPPDDCGSGRDADSDDPVPVELDTTCDGTIAGKRDVDHYTITVPEPGALLTASVAADITMRVSILRWNGTYAVETDMNPSQTRHVEAGEWRIKVGAAQWNGTPVNYSLTVTTAPFADTDDCGGPGDAAPTYTRERFDMGDAETARLVSVGGACTGAIDPHERMDIYAFTTDGASAVRVAVDRTGGDRDLDVRLFGHPWHSWFLPSDGDGGADYVFANAAAQTFTLVISTSAADEATPYTLTLTTMPLPGGDDCASGTDLPLTLDAAGLPVLAAGDTCAGALPGDGDIGDAFALEAPAAASLLEFTYATDGRAEVMVGSDGAWGWHRVSDGWPWDVSPVTGRVVVPAGAAPVAATWHHAPWEASNHTLNYTYHPDPQDDCGLGHDAPGASTLALNLPRGSVACAGALNLSISDGADWYRIPAEGGDLVAITVDSHTTHRTAYALLVDEATGETLRERSGWMDDAAWGNGRDTRFEVKAAGPLLLKVRHVVDYGLNVTLDRHEDLDDCGAGRDADLHLEGPVPIGRHTDCTATFSEAGDREDAYAIDLAQGDALVVRIRELSAEDGFADVTLIDPVGNARDVPRRLYISDRPLGTAAGEGLDTENVRVYMPVDKPGTWTLVLNAHPAAPAPFFDYELRVDAVGPGGV